VLKQVSQVLEDTRFFIRVCNSCLTPTSQTQLDVLICQLDQHSGEAAPQMQEQLHQQLLRDCCAAIHLVISTHHLVQGSSISAIDASTDTTHVLLTPTNESAGAAPTLIRQNVSAAAAAAAVSAGVCVLSV